MHPHRVVSLVSRSLLAVLAVALVLPLFAVTVPAQAPAREVSADKLVIEDLVGDPFPYGVVDAQTPLGDAYSHIDIERFVVQNERPDSFEIVVDLKGSGTATPVVEAVALQDLRCSFSWTFDEHDEYDYGFSFSSSELVPGEGHDDVYGSLRRWKNVENDRDYDYWYDEDGVFTVTWDRETHAFTIVLNKAFVTTYPDDTPPRAGNLLTPDYLDCSTDVALYGQMGDRLDLGDHGFRFSDPGAGTMVTVAFEGDYTSGLGLVAGETAVVPVIVHNTVDARRIVALTAAAFDAEDAVLPWNLTVAPRIDLQPLETRAVKLIVTPAADATPGGTARVQVDLAVLGQEAPGRAAVMGRIVPLLGPGKDTYRFFSEPVPSSQPENALATVLTSQDVTLSLLDSVPGHGTDPVQFGLSSLSSFGRLDPLGRAVRFDPDGEAVLKLDLSSSEASDVRVRFVYSVDEEVVHSVDTEVTADGVKELRMPVRSDVTTFAAGAPVQFDIYLNVPSDVQATFKPETSSLQLPLLPVSQSELRVTDGRFLPTLTLGMGEEREMYVNRDRVYAFELVLANEGVETDDLRVSARAENATDWELDLVPGRAFRVPAGNATYFGVQVRAPPSAVEGDRIEIVVEAVSTNDPAAMATIQLAATVAEIEIEEKPYGEKENQIPPIREGREAPGLPLVFALFGLVAVAVARRRPV